MRVLVDSNALLWAVDAPAQLGAAARSALLDAGNDRLLSAATIWEISVKVGLKKLSLSMPFLPWINKAMMDLKMSVLPITAEHADAQISLPTYHRDPFDRLLISQAQVENVPIISADEMFERYGIARIWD